MNDDSIKIRFKLKGESEIRIETISKNQYDKIKKLPIMEFCEIFNEY